MARRFAPNYIPISRIAPGSLFTHYQEPYRRATEAEVAKHPGRELQQQRGEDKVVLAYMVAKKGGGRTPVSFNSDTRVVVPTRKRSS